MTTKPCVLQIREQLKREAREFRETRYATIQAVVLMSLLVGITAIVVALHFDTRGRETDSDYGRQDRSDITSLVIKTTK